MNKDQILEIVDNLANEIYQEYKITNENKRFNAYLVAGIDLIYNYRMELQNRLEKHLTLKQ